MRADPFVALATGFLQGYTQSKMASQEREQQLLVNAVNNAVQSGQPEALGLLNPERLAVYGLDQFIPLYTQLATTVGKQKAIQLRQMEAQTGLAETQRQVAAATAEPTIQAAQQKARAGQLEVQQLERREMFFAENPRLAMLPELEAQSRIEGRQAEIRQGDVRLQQGWAQLAETKRAHNMANARAAEAARPEQYKMRILQEMEKEDPNLVRQALFPQIETAANRNARLKEEHYRIVAPRMDSAMNTFQKLMLQEKTAAEKEGRKPYRFTSEAEANNFLAQVTTERALYEAFKGQLGPDVNIDEFPTLPEFTIETEPGYLYGVRSWSVTTKDPGVADILKQIGVDPTLFKPRVAIEKPAGEAPTGRRIAPELGRARAERPTALQAREAEKTDVQFKTEAVNMGLLDEAQVNTYVQMRKSGYDQQRAFQNAQGARGPTGMVR